MTFSPIFVLAPIIFFSAPEGSKVVILVGSLILTVMAFKVVAVNEENRALNQTITEMAEIDYLTGVFTEGACKSIWTS